MRVYGGGHALQLVAYSCRSGHRSHQIEHPESHHWKLLQLESNVAGAQSGQNR